MKIFGKKVLLKKQAVLLLFYTLSLSLLQAQVTLSTDDFENTFAVFSLTSGTGAFYSGNSAAGDRPASSPFAVSGTYGYGVTNNTAVITSSNINTFGYTSIQLNLRVSSFSIANTGNGADNTDIVQLEVSPDGGTTYYNTVKVTGNSNAYWSYSSGSGNANTPYDGNSTPVTFQPGGGGSRTTDGYSTITVTSLPSSLNLRIRITLQNNSNNERWVIDNFTVTGLITTPIVLSPTATSITESSATLGGTITNAGASSITERGTVYKTSSGVTISDNPLAEGGTATGLFLHTRSGLSAQTLYYYKAYAKNSNGNGLSPESNFYTLSNPPLSEATNLTATPIDIDEIDLSWTAASFPSSGASSTGYIILRRQDYTNPDTLDIIDGIAPASQTLSSGTTLVTTITSGSTVAYNNTGLSTNTQYNYMIIPFTWNGTNSGTYNYYLTNTLTGNALTLGATGSTADFRTKANITGNWSAAGTSGIWQSYNTTLNKWQTATVAPTSSANSIEIRSGCSVTIDAPATANALIIDNGGILNHPNNYSFNIADGTGYDGSGVDFIIDGTYVLNGAMPAFLNSASAQVNSTGIVRVDGNTGGGSDDFARLANVLFKTSSIFQWNTANAFEAGGSTSGAVTYFPSSSSADKPIFRITTDPGFLGGSYDVTFNGKIESTLGTGSNILFKNNGTKIFRDGIGGNGKFTNANAGTFKITGSSAVIDGTVIINLNNGSFNEMEIADNASVTVSGSPQINVNTGSTFVINGTLTQTATTPVYLDNANLVINGYIDDQSTKGGFRTATTTSNSNTVTIGNNTTSPTNSASVGMLKFYSSGGTNYNYVNTFTMQRTVSRSNASVVLGSNVNTNNLILSKGILATDNHLFTYTKVGSTFTLPSSYANSYICTCDATGTEIASTGSNGFRINSVSSNTEQIFPVGTDFVSANRMGINMNGLNTNTFTVVVGKGDIGGTPLPRVNRIWYVTSSDTAQATMKLYFTKWPWYVDQFGVAQDEVEDGFNYDDSRLVQRDYTGLFVNATTVSTSDVLPFTGTPDYTEIYGLYSYNVSTDYRGLKKGINGFTRFSVINLSDIILPVSITNFKAYKKNDGVQIEWSALNEMSVDHYEVERSTNGINFTSLGAIKAINNSSIANYTKLDSSPAQGKNFYRVKAIDKNGKISYTAIATVIIGSDKTSITIYPNPVQHKLINVQFSNIPQDRYQLIFYNNLGTQVFKTTIEHAGGSATQSFLLPLNAKAGAYVMKLFNEKLNFTSRVIVE